MSSIEDPLAKPRWPDVDAGIQEAILNQLIALKSSGNTTDVLVGFNAVMTGLETHFQGKRKVETLFVARHDISGFESMPLALSSAAGKIRLVSLPKGSKKRLGGVSVMCTLSESTGLTLLEQFVRDVGPAESSWAYIPAKSGKLPKKTPQRTTKTRN